MTLALKPGVEITHSLNHKQASPISANQLQMLPLLVSAHACSSLASCCCCMHHRNRVLLCALYPNHHLQQCPIFSQPNMWSPWCQAGMQVLMLPCPAAMAHLQ